MANAHANPPNETSLLARFRRELRNPSMTTVILIIVAVTAVPLAILVPSWVSTTQKSIQDRNAAERLRDAQLLSSSVLVPSQIVPWMLNQVKAMEEADSPADWSFTSFTGGPCHSNNLRQLPPGEFSDAIATSCTDLHAIQVDHADECPSIQVCNFSTQAGERLDGVRTHLLTVFEDADFVIPYRIQEEESG